MEALLVYNPNAGGASEEQALKFKAKLESVGYNPTYIATKTEEDLDDILCEAKGIVVAVGGDGTLRAVATRLLGRDVPLALIPNGTANNVGRTLGIEGEPMELIDLLPHAQRLKIDVGKIKFPWGESCFLEGAGMGLFAEALSTYRPEDGKSFLRGCKTLLELMAETPSRRIQARIDGQEIEGEFILLQAMNMGAIGPRITLAPFTDPGDGMLDIIWVEEKQRESYLKYLYAIVQNEFHELESVEMMRAQTLEIKWAGAPIHMDASYLDIDLSSTDLDEAWVSIGLSEGALEFLVPNRDFIEVKAAKALPSLNQSTLQLAI